jgi:hypothetical protein
MNPEKIGPLYEDLSEHFEVPMIEWKILPKPNIQTKFQKTVKTSSGIQVRRLWVTDAKGHFIDEPTPRIVFYGVPTLDTVMHEFMHYLVYCTKKKE